ncbi:MAG: hypothetical protein QM774_06845 [Gordonia sp. (in: high G+C Gram-positive bacteria)]|uniref:hypothetical protein n=1 Tax=Gordonia sp. (in: high G+C Gram-positive bacteria) TaxID=84139 RepID=UPI0039E6F83E
MTTGAVVWVGLGEHGFSRIVQIMVKRRWAGIADVHAPDGRGGDGGIDILAVDQGERRRIYQIKYFPDGFSGDRKTTRQNQIKKSYDTALKLKPPPYEWTLVVPKNLTPGERRFVVGLADDDGPKITIWDSDDLDEMIAGMPDIYNYLVRDQLEHLVRKYGLETAPLLGRPDDLGDRLTNLRDLASALNPHWGVDMTITENTITYGLRPKHPGAATDDPIRVELGFKFESADDPELAPFKRSIAFGARGNVYLSSRVVNRAAVQSSHPLFNTEIANPGVVIAAHSRTEPREAEFRFVDSSGAVLASQDAVLEHAGDGVEGGSMAFRVLERIEIEFDFAIGVDGLGAMTSCEPGGPMQLKYRLAELYPDETSRCIEFLSGLSDDSNRCEVHIEGKHAFTFTSDYDIDDALLELAAAAYDLLAIQEDLDQRFKMPSEISTRERIDLRVARAVLEGYFIESPGAANFNVEVIPAQIDVVELDRLLADGQPVNVPVSDFALRLGNRVLPITDVRATTSCAKVLDGHKLKQAVEAGQRDPFPAVMRPAEHRYFLLYKVDRIPEDEADRQQVWWTLPGIEQPGEPSE